MATVLATVNFRTNLRSAMTVRGLSQREVATRAHVTHPNVNRILTGKAVPSLEVCDKLADAVGLDLTFLLQPPRSFTRLMETAAKSA